MKTKNYDLPQVEYKLNNDGRKYWCNSHNRFATFIMHSSHNPSKICCSPKLGGILLPCFTVDITDCLEIEE